eukprot:CAMPEP_0175045334 /NCGR_PEP_ID=MMETSP0052_2-20121109/4353_1 /TAXON_ID=51329 ORGANISM="Polytomella parva, Strain SAG 63-3" /NCGR_SAMPLE_ID=MMETSP0052_2 /ASSEMBLY_ACC=CAM_ASM_000194 /LENGTH=229 /DNA_ID=CAMNT_0016308829 /DNA_START=143 /DNA_END=829 /DNA_ORIENTATION=+
MKDSDAESGSSTEEEGGVEYERDSIRQYGSGVGGSLYGKFEDGYEDELKKSSMLGTGSPKADFTEHLVSRAFVATLIANIVSVHSPPPEPSPVPATTLSMGASPSFPSSTAKVSYKDPPIESFSGDGEGGGGHGYSTMGSSNINSGYVHGHPTPPKPHHSPIHSPYEGVWSEMTADRLSKQDLRLTRLETLERCRIAVLVITMSYTRHPWWHLEKKLIRARLLSPSLFA